MCGTAGFVSRGVKEPLSVLRKMNQVMIHRGPDEEGVYFSGSYGLRMQRLSIIDLARGRQPIWNEDKTIACEGSPG